MPPVSPKPGNVLCGDGWQDIIKKRLSMLILDEAIFSQNLFTTLRVASLRRTVTDTDSYCFFRTNHYRQREDDRGCFYI